MSLGFLKQLIIAVIVLGIIYPICQLGFAQDQLSKLSTVNLADNKLEQKQIFTNNTAGSSNWSLPKRSLINSSPPVALYRDSIPGGIFAPELRFFLMGQPIAAVATDFDHNGEVDFAIANVSDDNLLVMQNPGNWGMWGYGMYDVGDQQASICAGDIDNNGTIDLVAANANDNIAILKNNGWFSFQPPVYLQLGGEPTFVTVADLNGDSLLDIVAAYDHPSVGSFSIYFTNADGTFRQPVTYAPDGILLSIAVADLDSDNDNDMAVMDFQRNHVYIYINDGMGDFQLATTCSTRSQPRAVISADFNQDGNADLAVINELAGSTYIYINNGNATFQPPVEYLVGSRPRAICTADFNLDGMPDLAIANSASNNVSILINQGDGTFFPKQDYAIGGGATGIMAGDFDHAGYPDLATVNWQTSDGSFLFNVLDREARSWVIQGVVTSAVDGHPLANAIVTVESSPFSCLTDSNGIYRIEGMGEGSAYLKCEYPDYLVKYKRPNFSAQETLVVDIALIPICYYAVGDINGDGNCNGADVTYGVRYFKGFNPAPPVSCFHPNIAGDHYLYAGGDVNGDCLFSGSDITRLVAYFKGLAGREFCQLLSPNGD